jgi:hypothetical protein
MKLLCLSTIFCPKIMMMHILKVEIEEFFCHPDWRKCVLKRGKREVSYVNVFEPFFLLFHFCGEGTFSTGITMEFCRRGNKKS